MANACRIAFDNTDTGSFTLTCNTTSDIKWISIISYPTRSPNIYPGNAYTVSDMAYNWFIIAEVVQGVSPNNEYKIIGVFTKNSDCIFGIYLTSTGYKKLKINYAETETINIADIESIKLNNKYNCVFNTENEVNISNSESTVITIKGSVLKSGLGGWVNYDTKIQCDEGIIKYIFNLNNDSISDVEQSVVEKYTTSWNNMYIIFNTVTDEICAIVRFDNIRKSVYTYHIATHYIYQRPTLTSEGSSTAFAVQEIDIQGYYTVDISYPDGAEVEITNTEA